jgi:hypothetical protein
MDTDKSLKAEAAKTGIINRKISEISEHAPIVCLPQRGIWQ